MIFLKLSGPFEGKSRRRSGKEVRSGDLNFLFVKLRRRAQQRGVWAFLLFFEFDPSIDRSLRSMASFSSIKSKIFDREERKQYVEIIIKFFIIISFNIYIFIYLYFGRLIWFHFDCTGNTKLIFEDSTPTTAIKSFWTITVRFGTYTVMPCLLFVIYYLFW